jgi:hypothetical protein
MSRLYCAVFEAISVSAAQDLFSLQPAVNKPCAIHEIHITQDAGETSEQLVVRVRRLPATFTVGSGGAAITTGPISAFDTAFGATVRRNDTTAATTSGTAVPLRRMGDNVLNGWHWVFTPETRPLFVNGEGCVVNLPTAPGAALTMSGELIFEELV